MSKYQVGKSLALLAQWGPRLGPLVPLRGPPPSVLLWGRGRPPLRPVAPLGPRPGPLVVPGPPGGRRVSPAALRGACVALAAPLAGDRGAPAAPSHRPLRLHPAFGPRVLPSAGCLCCCCAGGRAQSAHPLQLRQGPAPGRAVACVRPDDSGRPLRSAVAARRPRGRPFCATAGPGGPLGRA